MPRYIMEIEAFQFLGKTDEQMASYPDWFKEEINSGAIAPCGQDFHVVGGDHIIPSDYIIKKLIGEAITGVVPEEEFNLAFKELKIQ